MVFEDIEREREKMGGFKEAKEMVVVVVEKK